MFRHVLAGVGGAGHQQRGAAAHGHAGRDEIDLAQLSLGHADQAGGFAGPQGARCHPGRPAGQRALVGCQFAQEAVGVVVGQQHLRRAGGQDHRLVHLRVELLEVVDGQPGQPRGQGHVDVALDVHAQEVRVVLERRQRHCKQSGSGHDVLHRLQLGHVVAGLVGHGQVRVPRAQTGAPVAVDGALHVALAPVVGRQRQVPVAEQAVQPLQVVQRSAGRGEHGAPVVAEEVLAQFEVLAGGGHELPHARGAGSRHRLRVEGTLDEGQQRQVDRHVAAFDFFDDVEQIAPAALGHALHIVGPRGIPLLPLAHEFVVQVGQGVAGADTVPQTGAGSVLVGVQAAPRQVASWRPTGGRLGDCGRAGQLHWCRRRRREGYRRRSDDGWWLGRRHSGAGRQQKGGGKHARAAHQKETGHQ